MIDKGHPIPLHYQLSSTLREEINSGQFKQGELFTTEKSLINRFNVSSTTVRRALNDLVQEGYLYRQIGKGTFVRRPYIEESLGPLSGFYEEMIAKGLKPSSNVLVTQETIADNFIHEKLHVAKLEPIYFIKKVLLADGEPLGILDSYWLLELGKILVQSDLIYTGSFQTLEKVADIRLAEAEAIIEADAANSEEAEILKAPKGTPLLIMKRVVYSTDGKAINYARYAYKYDKYKYRTRMIRNPMRQNDQKKISKTNFFENNL